MEVKQASVGFGDPMQCARPHEGNALKICGAKTRGGEPCKTVGMQNGRCRMHGGKSLSGMSHPKYKHGLYSKYTLEGMWFRIEQEKRRRVRGRIKAIKAMSDAELLAKARRLFGRSGARDYSPEEFREMLIAAQWAAI